MEFTKISGEIDLTIHGEISRDKAFGIVDLVWKRFHDVAHVEFHPGTVRVRMTMSEGGQRLGAELTDAVLWIVNAGSYEWREPGT